MNQSKFKNEQDVRVEIKPEKVNKAIAYACRVLGMQEHSQKSLGQKLKLKGYNSPEIAQAIEFLLENNWLSEQRFCEVFIRSKINRGQGLTRIQYELARKGISQPMIEQTLSRVEVNWQRECDQVTLRKIRASSIESNMKDRQKLERFLRYRGFSGEQVRKSMNKYI